MKVDIFFLNQGAVTVEAHTQLKNTLSNRERIKEKINHHSICATLTISVNNVMVRNQIRASDVYWRIVSLQMFWNQKLRIWKLTGSWKILKRVRIYWQKYIRRQKTLHIKSIHRKYTCLWNACLPIQKSLEQILGTVRNWPIRF